MSTQLDNDYKMSSEILINIPKKFCNNYSLNSDSRRDSLIIKPRNIYSVAGDIDDKNYTRIKDEIILLSSMNADINYFNIITQKNLILNLLKYTDENITIKLYNKFKNLYGLKLCPITTSNSMIKHISTSLYFKYCLKYNNINFLNIIISENIIYNSNKNKKIFQKYFLNRYLKNIQTNVSIPNQNIYNKLLYIFSYIPHKKIDKSHNYSNSNIIQSYFINTFYEDISYYIFEKIKYSDKSKSKFKYILEKLQYILSNKYLYNKILSPGNNQLNNIKRLFNSDRYSDLIFRQKFILKLNVLFKKINLQNLNNINKIIKSDIIYDIINKKNNNNIHKDFFLELKNDQFDLQNIIKYIKYTGKNFKKLINLDHINNNILHICCKYYQYNILKYILTECKFNNNQKIMLLNNKNKFKLTPLNYSISLPIINLNIIKLLISCKSDINTTDILNNTPLHYACTQNNTYLIKLLINNIFITSTKQEILLKYIKQNNNCLNICIKNKNKEIIDFILKKFEKEIYLS